MPGKISALLSKKGREGKKGGGALTEKKEEEGRKVRAQDCFFGKEERLRAGTHAHESGRQRINLKALKI